MIGSWPGLLSTGNHVSVIGELEILQVSISELRLSVSILHMISKKYDE